MGGTTKVPRRGFGQHDAMEPGHKEIQDCVKTAERRERGKLGLLTPTEVYMQSSRQSAKDRTESGLEQCEPAEAEGVKRCQEQAR